MLGTAGGLVRDAGKAFAEDEPFQLAASLSYYSLLSMAPLLLIVTGLAGFLLGQQDVQRELIEQARAVVGDQGATAMRTVLANADHPGRGIASVVVGLTLTVVAATTVLAQLQYALDRILGVEAVPGSAVLGFLRSRLVALAVLLGIGLLLLVTLVLTALVNAAYDHLADILPGAPILWQLLNETLSLVLMTVAIAALFKLVPNVRIRWADTWIGAFITALLMSLGKFLIGLYLGHASVGSAYGAAGSVVVLLVWIYYASLILFFGAELTKVIARHRGAAVRPRSSARLRGAPETGAPS